MTGFFKNSRGLHYLPEYTKQFPGKERYNPNNNFSGVGCPTAMWHFYDSEENDAQLKVLKRHGLNNVRVYMSFYTWNVEPDHMLSSVKDFARLLDKNRMYCTYNFFDTFQNGNVSGYTYSNGAGSDKRVAWYGCPAIADLNSTTFWGVSAPPYVEAMVSSLAPHKSTLIYEVFNEVFVGDFLTHANLASATSSMCNLIRATDPNENHMVSPGIGIASLNAGTSAIEYVLNTNPSVNLITSHPYRASPGSFRLAIRDALEYANQMGGKPSFFTECGNSDLLMYNSVVDEISEQSGIGVNTFQAFGGNHKSVYIYGPSYGAFDTDGKVRILKEAEWYRNKCLRYDGDREANLLPLIKRTEYTSGTDGLSIDFQPIAGHPMSVNWGWSQIPELVNANFGVQFVYSGTRGLPYTEPDFNDILDYIEGFSALTPLSSLDDDPNQSSPVYAAQGWNWAPLHEYGYRMRRLNVAYNIVRSFTVADNGISTEEKNSIDASSANFVVYDLGNLLGAIPGSNAFLTTRASGSGFKFDWAVYDQFLQDHVNFMLTFSSLMRDQVEDY